MKKLFYILILVFILLSCKEKTQYLGHESIKGKVSYKEEVRMGRFYDHYLYIQNPTKTRVVQVSNEEYELYNVGDPILLIIEKYQIPCKDNEDCKKPKVNYSR